MLKVRTTASFRYFLLVAVLAATLGCWNIPNLEGPFFDWLLVSARVWAGVASENPLPSGSEIELDPELLGAWDEVAEKPATWEFEALPCRNYRLQISARKAVAVFDGTLHRVGSHVFLALATSFFPESANTETGSGEALRIHAFFKLAVSGDVAQLEGINEARMLEAIEAGELTVDHRGDLEGLIWLTAAPPELAALLEHLAEDPAAFSVANGFELRR